MNGWRHGPPPPLGWWPTRCDVSDARTEGVRWWDGEFWSFTPRNGEPEHVEWCARQPCSHRDVQWSERPADWPERSHT